MKRRDIAPRYLINLKGIAALDFITKNKTNGESGGISIGAVTSLDDILDSPLVRTLYPVLTDAVSVLGTPQIRNTASMVGNLCNALPSADSAPPLIVLRAKLKIIGPEKERTVLVEDFFRGPRETVLGPCELVTEIIIPSPPPAGSGVYLKHMLRAEGDLAIAGVSVYLTLDSKKEICLDAGIALGAVAPTPMRAVKAEDALKGKPLDSHLIETAASIASEEAKPIDDIRSSAEYRREMVRALTKRAIQQSLKRA
jgi:carbon-monoxide dehydrogenase medium subunit